MMKVSREERKNISARMVNENHATSHQEHNQYFDPYSLTSTHILFYLVHQSRRNMLSDQSFKITRCAEQQHFHHA
jgi:hypothetical protein